MTKIELIGALTMNELPGDTEVLVSVKKYHNDKVTWDEVEAVDKTEHGAPILIHLGKTVMA